MKKSLLLKRTLILLIQFLNVGWLYTASSQNGWEQMKSMDRATGGSGSCVIDNMIYVFGGINKFSAPVRFAEVYNTETDEWSDLEFMPASFWLSNTEVINDKIYLTGGWRNNGERYTTIKTTYEYDPEADSWVSKKECPKKHGTSASCVLNGKFYLLGGSKDFPDVDTTGQKDAIRYDPASDSWDSIPDMLYAKGLGAKACVLDGQIYIFGGFNFISYNQNSIVGKAEKYNPKDNTWTELADMPVPVVDFVSMSYKGKIYAFGGDSAWTWLSTKATNIIQVYNPSTNEWRLMETMPFRRSAMTGQKVGNFAYLIGGYPQNSRQWETGIDEVWRINLDSLDYIVQNTHIYPHNISIYPNPTNNKINITGLKRPADIKVYNITGQFIKSFRQVNSAIDISELNTGVYIMHLKSNDKTIVRKVVKR